MPQRPAKKTKKATAAPRRTRRSSPPANSPANGAAHTQPAPAPAPAAEPIMSYADLPSEPPRWLWSHRIRLSAPTLLAGDQGAGKTTLAAAVVAMVTGGPALPGEDRMNRNRVLYLTREQSAAQDVRPLIRLAGGSLDCVKDPERLASGKRRRLTLPSGLPELLRIARGEGIGLLVIDPVTSYVDERLLPDSGSTARLVIEALMALGEESGVTTLAIKHPRKGQAGPLIERISGSREWIQAARAVLYLVVPSDKDTARVLVTLKPGPPKRPPALRCRLDEIEGAVRLDWEGECDFDERTLSVVDDSPAEKGATADAILFLRAYLEDGPQLAKDIARLGAEAMLSPHQLRRAREKLGIVVYHEGGNTDRAWSWQKPAGGWPV